MASNPNWMAPQAFFPKLGDHQLAFPMSLIADGTTIARTMVASTKTAIARANPIDLIIITSAKMKPENTAIIMAAAFGYRCERTLS